MTARLLAARIGGGIADEGWTSTLRACSAHDAYLRTYQQGVQAERVLEFLLIDRLFPRSVFHALRSGEEALTRLDPASGRSGQRRPGPPGDRPGPHRPGVPVADEALLEDLAERLHGLQRTVSTVSEEVTRQLFTAAAPLRWSIEEAGADELADRGPAPHGLPVRRAGAGVVQRGAADPAERRRAAHPAVRADDHAGGDAAALRRLLGHDGRRVRRPRAAHRAGRAGDGHGGDRRPAAAADRRAVGGHRRPGGTGPLRRAARPVPVRAGRAGAGASSAGRCGPAATPVEAGLRAAAVDQRVAAVRARRDARAHLLGRGAGRRPGRVPGLRARHARPAACRRPAGPVRVGLPAPDAGRGDRRGDVAGESHAWVEFWAGGWVAARPDQPRRRRQPARAAGAAVGTTRTYGRCPASTPGTPRSCSA